MPGDLRVLSKTRKLMADLSFLDSIDPHSKLYWHTCFVILRTCRAPNALSKGKGVHAHLIKSGQPPPLLLMNILLNIYAKSGIAQYAFKVFEEMPERDIITWTTMIDGYARSGDGHFGIMLFMQMMQLGLEPNKVTYVTVLSACATIKCLCWGKYVHSHLQKSGINLELNLGNALIGMYVKCESIEDTCHAFDRMDERDRISWTVLVSGYSQLGNNEAMTLFQIMQEQGLKPDMVTYISILGACSKVGALEFGRYIHACLINVNQEWHVFVAGTLVDMYSKCGSIIDAHRVFQRMTIHDVVSQNALMLGYALCGNAFECINFFVEMQESSLNIDEVTYMSVLIACADAQDINWGKYIHSFIIKSTLQSSISIGSTLIAMYAKCGRTEDGCKVFELMPRQNIVSWTALISAHAENQKEDDVFELYCRMQEHDLKPDKVTYISILGACASAQLLEYGKQVHACLIKSGYGQSIAVGSTLIDMYAKCGNIDSAKQVFDRMPIQVLIPWTMLISGYADQGDGRVALELFEQMKKHGLEPDEVTYVSVLRACASEGALDWGKSAHILLLGAGMESNIIIGNALIGMYSKCGSIDLGCKVFNAMPIRDIISWNAMITGHAQHGNGVEVLQLFEQMQLRNVKPDELTFISVLAACSHMGYLDLGHHYFASMTQIYNVQPKMEHYACLVDLHGRAGHLHDAKHIIDSMPVQPSSTVWMAFLGACRIYMDGSAETGFLRRYQGHQTCVPLSNSSLRLCHTNG